MKSSTKYGLTAIAIVGLAAAGVASAHGMLGPGGWRAVDENCTDDMTVGECRTSIEAAREAAWLQRCSDAHDAAFCNDLMDLQTAHQADLDAFYNEYDVDGPVHFAPPGHSARDWFRPVACDDDVTVAECRAEQQAAMEQARLEACSEEYGDEFCQALFDLQEAHQAERQALYDEYGIDAPAFGAGHGRPHTGPGPHGGHGFRHN